MPTYEYACDKCGYEFEKFQSINAGALRKCPRCGKNALRRLIGTGSGIIFKGSGFYETDYRSENYKKAAEKEKKGSEKKDTKKTDSKSTSKESKSETKAEKAKDDKKKTA